MLTTNIWIEMVRPPAPKSGQPGYRHGHQLGTGHQGTDPPSFTLAWGQRPAQPGAGAPRALGPPGTAQPSTEGSSGYWAHPCLPSSLARILEQSWSSPATRQGTHRCLGVFPPRQGAGYQRVDTG